MNVHCAHCRPPVAAYGPELLWDKLTVRAVKHWQHQHWISETFDNAARALLVHSSGESGEGDVLRVLAVPVSLSRMWDWERWKQFLLKELVFWIVFLWISKLMNDAMIQGLGIYQQVLSSFPNLDFLFSQVIPLQLKHLSDTGSKSTLYN